MTDIDIDIDIDIDAIRQREQAATKGPWKATSNNCIEAPAGFRGRVVASVGAYESGWPSAPDAEFIAHAREDVPALLNEVDRLRTELDRRQAVVDAAEQLVASHRIDTGTWVDTERIQGDALQQLADALEALNGEGTVQPLTAEPDSNVTVVYDRVGAAWSRDENGSWRMRGEGVPWRFHNLAREFGPITMRPAR